VVEPVALPAPVPAVVRREVDGAVLLPVGRERTPGGVWRVLRPGHPDRFVKRTPAPDRADPWAGGVIAEAERLRWLAGRVPVPEVVVCVEGSDGSGWMVTAAAPGSDATDGQHHFDADRLIRALGEGLRRFHDEVPVVGCPFDTRLEVRMAAAAARVAGGRVDVDDLEPIYRGRAPEALLDVLGGLRPGSAEDLVVVHGDYCFPNVLLQQGRVTGYVDLGRCGVADRYVDLAVAARSVAHNMGGHAVGPFFAAYGIDWPDVAKIDFYVLLDEFF